jgi:hypothetical protein
MLRFTTPLLAIAFGFMVSSFSASALAQHKVANDPFKYPVFEGNMACDDKVMVVVAHDKKMLNHFVILMGKAHYKAQRVPTDSGAIRLEDKAHGIVWLQMSNKSMLFNEKVGKRLANNCRNDAQKEVEVALQIQPDTSALGKP